MILNMIFVSWVVLGGSVNVNNIDTLMVEYKNKWDRVQKMSQYLNVEAKWLQRAW